MVQTTCAVFGCGRQVRVSGWCTGHYGRWHRHGDVRADVPLRALQPQSDVCGVDDCGAASYSRGLCKPHYQRHWYEQNRDAARLAGRKHNLKRYGLTPETYAAMLDQQDGHCAICPAPADVKGRLWVDHDHATGEVRGLLCPRCNTVAGLLGDDTELARGLIAYLESGGPMRKVTGDRKPY